MEARIIKFNKKLYSGASIEKAVEAYQKNLGQKNLFKLKKNNQCFELEVLTKKYPENFVDEFCNYVLYLNFK